MQSSDELVRSCLRRLVDGESLSTQEARDLMNAIMRGEASEAQIAGLLVALRMKEETVEEIAGFAQAMRDNAVRLKLNSPEALADTCGTGGDGAGTFNISTAAAIVAAGAGARIAKHGNRSVSSRCGSADLLEAIGVKIDVAAEVVARCIEEAGIGFLFAPRFHPAMKHAIGPRRQLGLRTVFNILGPLTNPAGARRQLLGVFSEKLVEPVARVLLLLGVERAMVVHGLSGIDEIDLCGPTQVSEIVGTDIANYTISPEDLGFESCEAGALSGGSVEENVEIMQRILSGEGGPYREATILNAGAALVVAGKAESIPAGAKLARESIESGAAKAALGKMIQITNES